MCVRVCACVCTCVSARVCARARSSPAPTQAVRRAEVHARRPRQQPPGVLLGEAPLLAEERLFFRAEKHRVLQPGKSEVLRSRAAFPRPAPRGETRLRSLACRSSPRLPPVSHSQEPDDERRHSGSRPAAASSGRKQPPGSPRGREGRGLGHELPAAFKALPLMPLPLRGPGTAVGGMGPPPELRCPPAPGAQHEGPHAACSGTVQSPGTQGRAPSVRPHSPGSLTRVLSTKGQVQGQRIPPGWAQLCSLTTLQDLRCCPGPGRRDAGDQGVLPQHSSTRAGGRIDSGVWEVHTAGEARPG